MGRAPHPDGTEVHPDRWWEAYQAATDEYLLEGVQTISVGGQQDGLCALDESGAIVRDALLWNGSRSAQASRDWSGTPGCRPFA
jgi:xylulokinase